VSEGSSALNHYYFLLTFSDEIIQIALAIEGLGNYQLRLVALKALELTTHPATVFCSSKIYISSLTVEKGTSLEHAYINLSALIRLIGHSL